MPHTSPTRRRWFQFSLGTMLLLVTAFAVGLGTRLSWIGQRHAYVRTHPEAASDIGNRTAKAPGFLWLLGEPGRHDIMVDSIGFADHIEFHRTNPPVEAIQPRALFPEANIMITQPIKSGRLVWATWRPREEWDYGKQIDRP